MSLKVTEMVKPDALRAREGGTVTSGEAVQVVCTLVGLGKALLEPSYHFHCL